MPADGRMNHVLHMAAVAWLRHGIVGSAYYGHKLGESKASMEAVRCLRRALVAAGGRRRADPAGWIRTGPDPAHDSPRQWGLTAPQGWWSSSRCRVQLRSASDGPDDCCRWNQLPPQESGRSRSLTGHRRDVSIRALVVPCDISD